MKNRSFVTFVLSYPSDIREILKRGEELVFQNEQNIFYLK